jgi:hypothetical protein
VVTIWTGTEPATAGLKNAPLMAVANAVSVAPLPSASPLEFHVMILMSGTGTSWLIVVVVAH